MKTLGVLFTIAALTSVVARAAELRVMTFNILEGGRGRHEQIAGIIHECGADIVGVQECGSPAPLLKQLGTNWNAVATGKSGYTSGILSKFPLEKLVAEDFLTAVRVKLPGSGSVVVVNAHWWPPKNSGVTLIQQRLRAGKLPSEPEILTASDASNGPRGYRHTLEVLRSFLQAGENVILTGDFNESSHLDWTARAAENGMDRWVKNPTGRPLRFKMEWKGSKLLADAGLRDAYRTVFPDEVAKPGITWTPPYPAGTPGRRPYDDQVLERIDMIYFAGKNLKVVSAGVVGESKETCEIVHAAWPSDHRAVVAAFTLADAGKHVAVPAIAESAFCRSLEYTGKMVQEPGWHIWGCSPIVGEDGKVHLFVERWPTKPRGFDAAWRHDSEIAHYVGDTAEGPFKFRDVALKGTGTNTWDRFAPANPCIQKVDGKYVLVYIGNPVGMTKGMGAHPGTQRIGMAIADSLDGPWRKVGKDGKMLDPSPDPKHWTHGAQVVNPAFLKFNGKYLLYFKGKGANMGVAVADKLEGPYLHQPNKLSADQQRVEDGTAFLMDGTVCFVTTDNAGKHGRGSGLLWKSDDGIRFSDAPERGYYPPSHYLPKVERTLMRSYYGAGTFQRPQVLMQNGRPTHLYVASGSIINGADGTVCYVLHCKPEGESK